MADILGNLNLSEEERHALLNNKGLSATNLLIPSVYKEAFWTITDIFFSRQDVSAAKRVFL